MAKRATIKVTSDIKSAESGIDKLTSELNKFAKNNQTLNSLSKLNGAFQLTKGVVGGATSALRTGTEVIKKVGAEMERLTEAANVQIKAETQLAQAAKNNPYLDDNSVIQLKNYASKLQSITAVGDEALIPLMAQLAAAGRTQAEIQDIMSAALDVSASGTMSLESAVKNLNKTFSGLSGELGESIPEIKNLTKEQLKNGEAVKVIASQYKGMAEEVANATGSLEKMEGARGDFEEQLGMITKPTVDGWHNFWTAVYQKGTDIISKLNGKLDEFADKAMQKKITKKLNEFGEINYEHIMNEVGNAYNNDLSDYAVNRIIQKSVASQTLSQLEATKAFLENEKALALTEDTIEKKIYDIVKIKYDSAKAAADELKAEQERQEQLRKEQEEAERARKAKQDAEKETAKETAKALQNRRDELRAEYQQSIDSIKTQIETRRAMGEAVSEEEENQLLLNAAMSAYIKMYSDPAFDRSQTKTGMWEGEQEQRNYIQALADKAKVAVEIEDLKKKSDEILAEATKYVSKDSDVKLSDSIKTEIESLKQYMENTELSAEQYEALTQRKIELEQLFTEVVKKESEERAQKTMEDVAKVTEVVTNYVDKFAEITNGITSLIRQNNEVENEEAMTALSEQYTNGIISYEEYCEKKKALDKKAAQEEYKLKMWEWTASFLQATANIAQGVAKALAEGGPYAGPILAALIGASGAVQIATITANKPKPPSFATGGIVPGNSYSGDKVQANVNSGEMILNAQQQANLWKMANSATGGSGAVVNMPVTIENNASDAVSASAELSSEGLVIMVNKIVNSQMAAGKYNKSMDIAQSRRRGLEIQ